MFTNKKEKASHILFVIGLFFLGIASISVFYTVLRQKGVGNEDFYTYWSNFAYSIRGYDINYCKNVGLTINSIGKLEGITVMPYGRILGNIICPGFLPFKAALVYYYVILFTVIALLYYKIYSWIKQYNTSKILNLFSTLSIIIIPWYWADCASSGNIGPILSLLAILSAFYIKDRPNFAAFLLSLSLIKPQIGALFLFVLLLKKNYKMVIKVIGIIAASWGTELIYVITMSRLRSLDSQDILHTISDFSTFFTLSSLESGSNIWWLYYGIFDFLSEYGVSNVIIAILSAITAILFIFIIFHMIRDTQLYQDYVVIFSIAALASVFWFYKSQGESVVIILCNLMILYWWMTSDRKLINTVIAGISFVLMNCIMFRYIFRLMIPIFSYKSSLCLDMLVQIIVYIIIMRLLSSKYKPAKIQTKM